MHSPPIVYQNIETWRCALGRIKSWCFCVDRLLRKKQKKLKATQVNIRCGLHNTSTFATGHLLLATHFPQKPWLHYFTTNLAHQTCLRVIVSLSAIDCLHVAREFGARVANLTNVDGALILDLMHLKNICG